MLHKVFGSLLYKLCAFNECKGKKSSKPSKNSQQNHLQNFAFFVNNFSKINKFIVCLKFFFTLNRKLIYVNFMLLTWGLHILSTVLIF